MNLNILLRGQSNAIRLDDYGLAAVQAHVQQLLGFDGTANTITLIADHDRADGGPNTMYGGTAFLSDWIAPKNGDYTQGWTNQFFESALLQDVASRPAAVLSSPTAVVWLQNEYDSRDPALTTAEWVSGLRYDAAQLRQVLGNQSAATTPYLFIDAIPYSLSNPDSNQRIKLGMAQLTADASFNAAIAAHFDDVNMNGDGAMGGQHMSPADAAELVDRVANSVATAFAGYALPGSPFALAGGNIDDLGPQVTKAQSVAGQPNQVLLSVTFDAATALQPLDSVASLGAGWFENGSISSVGGQAASAATLVDASHLLLTFANPVPSGDLIFYGFGYGRVVSPVDQSGLGHGIYDEHGMPVFTAASGVAVTGSTTVTPPAPTPGTTTIGSGADTLVLKISEDRYLTDALYTIKVDGVQIGGTLTAAASHALGQDDTLTVLGTWTTGSHVLEVNFLNDAWNPATGDDRNLYVDGITFDGQTVPGGVYPLKSAGPVDFGFAAAAAPPSGPMTTTIGSGADTLVLKISEDRYLTDALYTIKVDGVQIGGTLAAAASHALGQDDILTVKGNWATGSHVLEVNFLNDAWNPATGDDRNLYVDGITFDGQSLANSVVPLRSAGPWDYAFVA